MFRFGRTTANRLFSRPNHSTHNRLTKSQRLVLDKLEERTVPALFTVNVLTDSGPAATGSGSGSLGDLRSAVASAKAGDIIDFDSTVFASSQTITLSAANGQLPAIATNITIQP